MSNMQIACKVFFLWQLNQYKNKMLYVNTDCIFNRNY